MFNSSNWFLPQDVLIMAIDDDIILESPYGAVVSLTSISDRTAYNKNTNLTLVITEADRGECVS